MILNRREFLQKSLVVTATSTTLYQAGMAEDLHAKSAEGEALIERMRWLREPSSWKKSSGKIVAHATANTDFWREPPDDIRDNGHFFHLAVSGDFSFQARFHGKYTGQYDHAGLMVRVDAENWMKCGTEFFDGMRHASVVFTRQFSDWSSMPDLSQDAPVWWRVIRKKNWIETLASLDGENFTSIRQGYFVAAAKTDVGVMCAVPKGAGFDVSFDEFILGAH